jgi:membrane fusion protein, copper/silver efflux system
MRRALLLWGASLLASTRLAFAQHVHDEPRVPITVPAEQQVKIGLRVARIEREHVQHTVRTVGTVAIDQSREAHVHTRFAGWIEDIRVSRVGQRVQKGETLCFFYSPELVSIQEEYLASRGRGAIGQEVSAAALERLRLLGVPEREIRALAEGRTTKVRVPIDSPIDGYVIEKEAIHGVYVTPEMHLYRIADLESLWILATLYEYDLPVVRLGDAATVSLTYEPERRIRGRITYIYPEVDPRTRTSQARLEVSNADRILKPGMYVNVEIEKDLGEVVLVPDSAVIDTGVRKIVFVRSAETRFEPREVTLGPRSARGYAVVSGLAPGDEVVASANFLLDAESRFQAAIEKGLPGAGGGHAGHDGK